MELEAQINRVELGLVYLVSYNVTGSDMVIDFVEVNIPIKVISSWSVSEQFLWKASLRHITSTECPVLCQ